jgi:hypothetical protein
MIRWLLILYLINPNTSIEETRFVITGTYEQCRQMQHIALHPNHRDKHPRRDRLDVIDAKCTMIDMEQYLKQDMK